RTSSLFFLLLFSLCSQVIHAQTTVTVGANNGTNTTTDYPCPIQDWYYATHTQYLYTAAELNALGIVGGSTITEIGWVVNATSITGHLQEDYSIFLLNTSATTLSLSSWETGATQVYGPTNYAYTSGYAGNVMFPVTSFPYTGGNLIVEVCGGISTGGYTNNPMCQWTTNLSYIASHQWRQDGATGCGNTDIFNSANEYNRPVMVVTYLAAAP